MAKKHRKQDSDGEGSVDSITTKVTKMKVDETTKLPTIRDIQLVSSTNFDPKKLKLDDEEESGDISRVALLYKYKNGERGLVFTCPNDQDAFFKCNGVEEDTYGKKGGVRVGTGKNVMKLYMDGSNEHHEKFHECLLTICAVVKKKVEKETGTKANVSIRGLYDLIDDEKNVTGHVLAARLIESNDGVVYTAAYNDEGQIHVKSVGRSIVRPGLTLSYTIPEDGETYRINASVAQVYSIARSLFPLRDLE